MMGSTMIQKVFRVSVTILLAALCMEVGNIVYAESEATVTQDEYVQGFVQSCKSELVAYKDGKLIIYCKPTPAAVSSLIGMMTLGAFIGSGVCMFSDFRYKHEALTALLSSGLVGAFLFYALVNESKDIPYLTFDTEGLAVCDRGWVSWKDVDSYGPANVHTGVGIKFLDVYGNKILELPFINPLLPITQDNLRFLIEHYMYKYGEERESSADELPPLLDACRKGDSATVQQLLASGCDVNATCDANGNTALAYAAIYGHCDIIDLLVPYAEIDKSNQHGDTALILAAFNERTAAVKRLIACGANVNWNNTDGETALTIAADRGCVPIVRELLGAPVNVNIQNKKHNTALMVAASWGYTKIVQLLLEAHADPNIVNASGETALFSAADDGYADVVRVLLAAHANPDIQDKYGCTALIDAACSDQPEVVKELLAAHANVDLQMPQGYTALMLAAGIGCTESVKLLIAAHADCKITDKFGRTALDCATNDEIKDLLKRYQEKIGQEEAAAVAWLNTAQVTTKGKK
jgi:ankyrin repeat protein